MKLCRLALLLAAGIDSCDAQEISNLQVGDIICAEGFVMDSFCINRGTLLDNPSVESLKGPDQHSVHCLVDIASCYTSPFEMLVAPMEGAKMYSRGWRFNDAGRQAIVNLGRTVGNMEAGCTTCESGNMGELEKGFRAMVEATVVSLNLESELMVPELELIGDPVHSNELSASTACMETFNRPNILDVLTVEEQSILFTSQTDASFRRKRIAHGSMMLIGWGILLPNGVLFARFFKHRPEGLWFKIHRTCQPVGLLFALTGWIIALANFDVFMDRDTRFIHGLVGSIVMSVGLLQPINAYFRPHMHDGEDKTKVRILWEHYHRAAGWTCFFLAVLVIFLGTTMLPQPSDQRAFQITYLISLLSMVAGLIFMKSDSSKSFAEFCRFRCTKQNQGDAKRTDNIEAEHKD